MKDFILTLRNKTPITNENLAYAVRESLIQHGITVKHPYIGAWPGMSLEGFFLDAERAGLLPETLGKWIRELQWAEVTISETGWEMKRIATWTRAESIGKLYASFAPDRVYAIKGIPCPLP